MHFKTALAVMVFLLCGCRSVPDQPTTRQALDRGRRLAEDRIEQPYESIKHAFMLKKPPKGADWMALYPELPQSFEDYQGSGPRRPDLNRFEPDLKTPSASV